MAEEENKLYPKSRLAEEIALADYASTLPLPVDFGTHKPYSMAGGQEVASKLFGTQGQERFQLWPERMVRSAVSAPYEALSGSFGPPGSRETTERMLEPAMDIAGLAITGPLAMKPGTASVGSGMTRMAKTSEAAVEHAPAFYSAVENAVKGAKQEKATAEQWLGFLKNQPGVKPEELAWTIKDLPSGQVTKKQLEDHIATNKVELKEAWKGNDLKPEEINEGYKYSKYHKYQLPGGENYRELLLTLPEKPNAATYKVIDDKGKTLNITTDRAEAEGYLKLIPNSKLEIVAKYDTNVYKSSHWDEPNVLAHIRMNDRTVNGKKTLHIEEIQSDWHQAGRKQGYKPEQEKKFKELMDKRNKILEEHPEYASGQIPDDFNKLNNEIGKMAVENPGVPDAPFKKTWDELALKKVIRHAAENGYDAISWTPGEAQAARYDLSKQVNKIYYSPETKKLVAYDKNNVSTIDKTVEPKDLPDVIGKEVADRILNNPTKRAQIQGKEAFNHVLEGTDLKIGGEGMKVFYDKMLVDKANALGKKFGSKVEQVDLDLGNKQMKTYPNQKVDKIIEPVHVMQITPEMKQQVLGKGFPLFSAGLPTLSPIDYDPFNQSHKMKGFIENQRNDMEKPTAPGGKAPSTRTRDVKLVPVDFDPFNPLLNKNAL